MYVVKSKKKAMYETIILEYTCVLHVITIVCPQKQYITYK